MDRWTIIHLAKTTAAQNEVALSYRSVRGLYFLAVVFVRSILYTSHNNKWNSYRPTHYDLKFHLLF